MRSVGQRLIVTSSCVVYFRAENLFLKTYFIKHTLKCTHDSVDPQDIEK